MTHTAAAAYSSRGWGGGWRHYEQTDVWTASGEFCSAAARQSAEYMARLSQGHRSATCHCNGHLHHIVPLPQRKCRIIKLPLANTGTLCDDAIHLLVCSFLRLLVCRLFFPNAVGDRQAKLLVPFSILQKYMPSKKICSAMNYKHITHTRNWDTVMRIRHYAQLYIGIRIRYCWTLWSWYF